MFSQTFRCHKRSRPKMWWEIRFLYNSIYLRISTTQTGQSPIGNPKKDINKWYEIKKNIKVSYFNIDHLTSKLWQSLWFWDKQKKWFSRFFVGQGSLLEQAAQREIGENTESAGICLLWVRAEGGDIGTIVLAIHCGHGAGWRWLPQLFLV